jgi:dihydroneopterin aldolase
MVFFGRHGHLPAERELGQRFSVDVELEADLTAARRSDRLEDTLNYVEAYDVARRVVEGEPSDLLERVAQRILEGVLELPLVRRATVRVHKRPPLPGQIRDVAVEVNGSSEQ